MSPRYPLQPVSQDDRVWQLECVRTRCERSGDGAAGDDGVHRVGAGRARVQVGARVGREGLFRVEYPAADARSRHEPMGELAQEPLWETRHDHGE